MNQLKIRVTVQPTVITVDKSQYQEAWDEYCEENSDESEGAECAAGTEPSDDFVYEKVLDELNDGTRDLAQVFEQASIDGELVDE
jgi:hypothetical protein